MDSSYLVERVIYVRCSKFIGAVFVQLKFWMKIVAVGATKHGPMVTTEHKLDASQPSRNLLWPLIMINADHVISQHDSVSS